MNIYKYHSSPHNLDHFDTRHKLSPQLAWEHGFETGEWNEKAIARSATYSYWYAKDILKGPFPLGEPAIAKDVNFAYAYARDVLKAPFPLGEPAIAKDGYNSIIYALTILRKRFKLGEPAIAAVSQYKEKYKQFFGVDL